EHQGTIEAERHATAVRQAGVERREQTLIQGGIRQAQAAALRDIALEAVALLARRGELVKAVGELDAVAVELESLRRARIVRIEAGKRRLAGGIAVHEGQRSLAEPWSDDRSHQQLEQLVAVRSALETCAVRVLHELLERRREGIELERLQECLAIAHPHAGAGGGRRAEKLAHQRLHLAHERIEREAQP